MKYTITGYVFKETAQQLEAHLNPDEVQLMLTIIDDDSVEEKAVKIVNSVLGEE